MIKSFLSLSLMLSLIAGSAQAATIDIDLADLSSTTGGSLTPNTMLLAPSTSLGIGAFIIGSPDPANPSNYSFAVAPSGSLYGGNYLAVLGNGSATISLAPNANSVGFTWGTIDSYNTVTFKDAANNTFAYTGAELLSALAALSPTAGTTQADVIFKDPFAAIVSATFTSGSNSFELANISAVPLPGSVGLMGLGLLALSVMAYRRKSI